VTARACHKSYQITLSLQQTFWLSKNIPLDRDPRILMHLIRLRTAPPRAHGPRIVRRVLCPQLLGRLVLDFFFCGVGAEDAAGGEGDAVCREVGVVGVGDGGG